MQASLDGLDPSRVLGRGYGILQSINGKVLSSVGDVNEGDEVRIVMRDGVLEAEVTRKG
jgi:exodeoxyribonuclease VII large subunit